MEKHHGCQKQQETDNQLCSTQVGHGGDCLRFSYQAFIPEQHVPGK
jgi:hypothetical protein